LAENGENVLCICVFSIGWKGLRGRGAHPFSGARRRSSACMSCSRLLERGKRGVVTTWWWLCGAAAVVVTFWDAVVVLGGRRLTFLARYDFHEGKRAPRHSPRHYSPQVHAIRLAVLCILLSSILLPHVSSLRIIAPPHPVCAQSHIEPTSAISPPPCRHT
jgi:hypothetical protein